MIRMRRAASITFIILLFASPGYTQKNTPPDSEVAQENPPKLSLTSRAERQARAVQEVRGLADRALRFQNPELKIRTLVQLADVLWDKGQDEDHARGLFLNTYALLKGLKPQKAAPAPGGEDKNATLTVDKYNGLLTLLMQKLNRHDAALAERLLAEGGHVPATGQHVKFTENVKQANELLWKGRQAEAVKAAERALEGRLSGMHNLLSLVNFMHTLRKSDAKAADELYLLTLAQFKNQPGVNAHDVLVLGNYLFVSASLAEHLRSAPQVFVVPARVGDITLQADISADRPNLSPASARAYLGLAAEVVSRPPVDAADGKLQAAAAHLLLPKAQRFNTEVAPRLAAVAAMLGDPPSAERPDTEMAAAPRAKGTDVESVLRELDGITETQARHKYLLSQFRSFYLRGDIDAASAVADKAQEADLRRPLADLVSFARATSPLESGQLGPAEQAVDRLGSPSLRRLLRLGMARAYLKKKETAAAENVIAVVIKEAQGGAEGAQQLYPLLNAVEMQAQVDATVAAGRLGDLVRAFNAAGPKGAATPTTWLSETVRYRDHAITFPLRVAGVSRGDFYPPLRLLALNDSRGVVSSVLEIRDESVLSDAIQALSRALLN